MTKPDAFCLGMGLGALAFPLGYRLACHFTGRQHLEFKEN